jgi:xanthine dehydrogenase accessory factor
VKPETLAQLNTERAARRPAIVVLDPANGEQRLVKAKDIAADPLRAELSKQLRMGTSGMVEAGGKKLFLNVYAPTAKLVIIGAVHISQALAPLARSLDYDVTVIDPRTAFASPERFPDVPLVADWPDVALPPLNVDHYTAFVAVTHDPKIDDPALLHAFERDCFYIGALGSRKTHAKRGERLRAQGASDADIARIHAPIGLNIGAVSPSEIAVAIMAEITAVLRLPKDDAKVQDVKQDTKVNAA